MRAQKSSLMRDRMLHDSLRALTDDASRLLDDQMAAGAEIPFEVGESSGTTDRDETIRRDGRAGRSATMFAYRPLTAEFVASHADQLRSLPTFESAAQHLARTRGMIAYLRVRNEPVLDVGELTHARLGALAFLSSVWSDAEHFSEWQDRFDRAYNELESVALAERLVTTVFVPVHGIRIDGESVSLGAGVELLSPEELDPECAERFSDSAAGADSFCSISVDAPSDAPTPIAEVRALARSVLTSLRLFKPGSVAMAMTAQADTGGAWHQVALPFSGKARYDAWHLLVGEDEELRQFLSAVRRVEKRTRVAWALKRFEMGLERSVPAEGLTDFLIALGALLEVRDETGKAAMPARISALCARDDERREVRSVVEAAFALERLAVDGAIGRVDRKRLAKVPPLEVIAETERHLRALLHDLVCGYLSTDLKALADEILTADGEPAGEDDLVPEPTYLEPVPAPGEMPAVDPAETVEFEAVFDDTAEISAVDMRDDAVEAGAELGDEAKVWTLRPASEIAPAPEVSMEPEYLSEEEVELAPVPEPTSEMYGRAEDVVERFSAAFDATVDETILEEVEQPASIESAQPETATSAIPAWEPSPERRPVTERPPAPKSGLHSSINPDAAATGFTFDFKKIDVPVVQQPPASSDRSIEPLDSEASEGVQAFPIPEFGMPVGQGSASESVDLAVDGPSQRESFREIMDENFRSPVAPSDESASTPFVRDKRAHLKPIEGANEELAAKPRIVHPEIFGSTASSESASPPRDPNATVEWDALTDLNSAEEAAQLAWSEQFLRRGEEPAPAEAPAPEADVQTEEPIIAEVHPLRLVTPAEELAVEPEPEADSEAESEASQTTFPQRPVSTSSESARSHKIGPATIEFRPVVDPNKDDPDDFAGAC